MEQHRIVIRGGVVQFIYDDALIPLVQRLGGSHHDIQRASHVEPHPTGTGWIVDLRPVGGCIYGLSGTSTTLSPPDIERVSGWSLREAALAFERGWLETTMHHRHVDVAPMPLGDRTE